MKCLTAPQEEEAYAELGEMMDPEDLAYLKQLHGQRSKAKKMKDKKKKKGGDRDEEDVEEYETKVMERHNKLVDEEETKSRPKFYCQSGE